MTKIARDNLLRLICSNSDENLEMSMRLILGRLNEDFRIHGEAGKSLVVACEVHGIVSATRVLLVEAELSEIAGGRYRLHVTWPDKWHCVHDHDLARNYDIQDALQGLVHYNPPRQLTELQRLLRNVQWLWVNEMNRLSFESGRLRNKVGLHLKD